MADAFSLYGNFLNNLHKVVLWVSGRGLNISHSTMLFFSEGSDYHPFYWQKTVSENGDMPKSIKA